MGLSQSKSGIPDIAPWDVRHDLVITYSITLKSRYCAQPTRRRPGPRAGRAVDDAAGHWALSDATMSRVTAENLPVPPPGPRTRRHATSVTQWALRVKLASLSGYHTEYHDRAWSYAPKLRLRPGAQTPAREPEAMNLNPSLSHRRSYPPDRRARRGHQLELTPETVDC